MRLDSFGKFQKDFEKSLEKYVFQNAQAGSIVPVNIAGLLFQIQFLILRLDCEVKCLFDLW